VQHIAETPVLSDMPRERVPTGESLIVLTRDAALTQILKALGTEHTLITVGSETDLAGELVSSQSGVAIIDAGAASTPVERLTERLKAQFPDLVLIVAGRLDDQSSLAAQITSGTVYRFLHKPVSDQRVKLFVDAAWRRHSEAPSGTDSFTRTGVLVEERAPLARNALWLGVAVIALALIAGGWFITRRPTVTGATTPRSSDAGVAAASDAQLESLLARADKALASGALIAPPGGNAAGLYNEALRRNPTDPRASAGIEKVIDKLLSAAETQLAAQHLDEAQKLTDQARAIKPDHVRAAFLTTQIGKERERFVLSQARQAAAGGHIEQAIAVLDGDAAGKRSSAVAAERQELEQQELQRRVKDYLAKAAERMQRGQLVEPAQDNSRFFIESARAIAPNQPEVQQAQQQLQDTLVGEARKALAAGNADVAQHWIDVAADSGVSSDVITDLTREAQRVQTSAKADAMARLALLFNQRLAQGHIVDPPSDSAQFYLSQLVQSDATHPSTVLARQALASRTLEEAKAAVQRQDYAGAQRWLSEARTAGNDDASISAIEHNIATAQTQDNAKPDDTARRQDTAKRAVEVISAGDLELTRYAAPTFPVGARQRGVSGWVDVQFLVTSAGLVTDVIITGSEPVGMFEQAAIDAVKKWRYKPMQRDGHPVDQRARLRMKFALDK
jgi:TonB family protein